MAQASRHYFSTAHHFLKWRGELRARPDRFAIMTIIGGNHMARVFLPNDDHPQHGDKNPRSLNYRERTGVFAGTYRQAKIADDWHRILTGRQSPDAVSARLKKIYGKVVAEKLPPDMLDLLARLESQSIENP